MTNDETTQYRHGADDARTGRAPRTGMPAAYYLGYEDGSDDMAVAA